MWLYVLFDMVGILSIITMLYFLIKHMDTLLINANLAIIAQNTKCETDAMTYANEISFVLWIDSKNYNEQRVALANAFLAALKKEMQHGLVKAGVFGSVSKNEAKDTSDLDIVLFVQPLTREERLEHNSYDAQLERWHGVYSVHNTTYNSHRISELERVFTEKTKIPVRCMVYFYNEDDVTAIQKEINFISIL